MNSNDLLRADLIDIIFDGRNKDYGAYALRKSYNRNLALATGIALSLLLLFFLLAGSGGKAAVFAAGKKDEVVIRDVSLPPEVKKPDPPAAQPARPQAASQQFTDRIQIVDRTPVNAMPVNAGLTNISDVTIAGPAIVDPYPSAPSVPAAPAAPAAPPVPEATTAVQREPEFPGGLQAWMAFLNRNLRVPDALEAGEKKTVMIRFEVGADGAVTGFEVVQSAGNVYNNEVIRVLKKMPKWTPAIQNNQPVARTFTQPVTFMGVED